MTEPSLKYAGGSCFPSLGGGAVASFGGQAAARDIPIQSKPEPVAC